MSQTNMTLGEEYLSRLLNRRLRSVIAPRALSPIQITGLYAVFGFVALYVSDVLLPRAIRDPVALTQLQGLKGAAEVVVTAGLILLLTTRSRQAIETRNERLDHLRTERDVLHRVFRHNLRQDINVIMGYTELIERSVHDDDLRAHCAKVLARTAGIKEYQEKIIKIEKILEPPAILRRIDLTQTVRNHPLIEDLRASDDVSISLDLPERSPVVAIASIELAIAEVLENAVAHNDSDDPKIWITIDENSDRLIDLVIADNGPGISDYERSAVEGMREEDLTHSSGLGLWLVKLACIVSGGALILPVQGTDGGKVVLQLPEAYDRTIRRSVLAWLG